MQFTVAIESKISTNSLITFIDVYPGSISQELELRLMKTENEREYNEQEAEKYAAAKEQLQAERAALQDELDALAAENKEIKDTSERLAQSLALVEETVQTEKAENELLRGQV